MGLASTLFLDCGNTRAKYLFKGQYGVVPYPKLEEFLVGLDVELIVYSSVAGEMSAIHLVSESAGVSVTRCLVEQGFGGLKLAYDDVSKLGVDRWLAMLKAAELVESESVWVADAGTALTIDSITAEGFHKGGLIAPGLSMAARSLNSNTADLPRIDFKEAFELGTDTSSCINFGVVQSSVALIESTVLRFENSSPRLLITGGDAEFISKHLSIAFSLMPNLVVDGLYLYWKLKTQGENKI